MSTRSNDAVWSGSCQKTIQTGSDALSQLTVRGESIPNFLWKKIQKIKYTKYQDHQKFTLTVVKPQWTQGLPMFSQSSDVAPLRHHNFCLSVHSPYLTYFSYFVRSINLFKISVLLFCERFDHRNRPVVLPKCCNDALPIQNREACLSSIITFSVQTVLRKNAHAQKR